jgi:hypothetical protein
MVDHTYNPKASVQYTSTISSFNLLHKAYWLSDVPTSLTFNNCTLCPHCIYNVFCIYLRTNSDLCHLQHKLIGFYNRDENCLLRGTDWVFKYSSLCFIFNGLNAVRYLIVFNRFLEVFATLHSALWFFFIAYNISFSNTREVTDL